MFNPRSKPRRSLVPLGLALAGVIVVAAVLPWAGYDNQGMAWMFGHGNAALRLLLLALCYGLAGVAAYQRTEDTSATALAILAAAVLGWSGWEWSPLSSGWVLFAALLLLISRPGKGPLYAGLGVVIWAMFDATAAWGALLLLLSSFGQPKWHRGLWLLAGGLCALAVLLLRGVDPALIMFPPARSWVWADQQATNSLADPAGLAFFIIMVMLLALALLSTSKPSSGNFVALAAFAALAWHARRNGIWLSLVAMPVIAAMVSSLPRETRLVRYAALGTAGLLSSGLLLALFMAPPLVGGQPLPPQALAALPQQGAIVSRPWFAPALALARPHARFPLLGNGLRSGPALKQSYLAWERIATNCAPLAELNGIDARAVVLDSGRDAAAVSTIATDARWRVAWQNASMTVLTRREHQP